MQDWRTLAWYQIAQLGALLGVEDPEVARRRELFSAIDSHCWPAWKEAHFARLEYATRTEAELLHYLAQSPQARDLLFPADPRLRSEEPRLEPPGPPGAPGADARSRALVQIEALRALLGGGPDPEVARRARVFVSIDRFAWPQWREAQFGQLEALTRIEGELLQGLLAVPEARDRILARAAPAAGQDPGAAAGGGGASGAAAVTTTGPADDQRSPGGAAPGATPGRAPHGEAAAMPAEPPQAAGPEPYRGPPAHRLYKDGSTAWNDFAASEFKQRSRAREAARRLKEIFVLLEKNPDGGSALHALEQVVGLSSRDVIDNALERRLR